jgi:hypothetical protein
MSVVHRVGETNQGLGRHDGQYRLSQDTIHDQPPDANAVEGLPGNAVLAVPLIAIPVLRSGAPDVDHRLDATALAVSRKEVHLEFTPPVDRPEPLLGSLVRCHDLLLVTLGERNGTPQCAGLEVLSARPSASGRLQVRARPGGRAAELLDPVNLTPTVDPRSLTFRLGFPEEALNQWAALGVLRSTALDRVAVCPRCHGLPTFRRGCPHCGSARLGHERLLHHFACAHVGRVADFEGRDELVCPKCRTRRLIVGSDYEYQTGPHCCQDCGWTHDELEHVAQCLRCGLRFPGYQAHELELRGYCADRLDLLAFAQAS